MIPPQTSRAFIVLLLGLVLGSAIVARADGPGELKFDQETFEAFEESGTALIIVERSGGDDGSISVNYSASGGTATAGSDFVATSGTLNWSDGDESSKTFVVVLLDDDLSEPEETILLTLSESTGGAVIDPERSEATLLLGASDEDGGGGGGGGDEAGFFSFSQSTFLATERAGVAVITVERTLGDDGAVSVDYRTSRGTATPISDYTEVSGTLTWADDNDDTQTFLIPIRNDSEHEDRESVHLALSNASGGAGVSAVRGSGLLEILDDDPITSGGEAGVLFFDERGFEAFEDAGVARVSVKRDQGSFGAVSVVLRTADATAIQGLDYETIEQTLFWADGEEGVRIAEVPILQDTLAEGNESVALSLSNPTGNGTIDDERSIGELTILDDDGDTTPCVADANTLCLGDNGQFTAKIVWRTKQGDHGPGTATALSSISGAFSFFEPDNIEMLIKVLDACSLPGAESYWVFLSATTDVDFAVTITDTATGKVKQYLNPLGQSADPILDTKGFMTCP